MDVQSYKTAVSGSLTKDKEVGPNFTDQKIEIVRHSGPSSHHLHLPIFAHPATRQIMYACANHQQS